MPKPLPNLWMTLPELIALSDYRLPAVDDLDPASWRGLRRGVVRPTSRARVRWLDKRGVFDIPKHWTLKRAEGWPVTVWSRPTVRQGEPRLYHAHDLLVVQLDSWLRREGLRNSQIVDLLRGRYALRYTLLCRVTFEPDAVVVYTPDAGGGGHLTTDREWSEFQEQMIAAGLPGTSDEFVFPLQWMGIFRGGLDRLRKMRKDSATVTSHRRAVSIDDLLKAQAPRVASVQVLPENT